MDRAGGRVCLLDDDVAVHAIVRHALEASGFEVSATTLWSDVGRSLVKDQEVILVCDLHLPGIRGEDFCRSVMKHNPSVRVLLFSGAEDPELNEAAGRLGGVPVVSKRSGVEELVRAIKRLKPSEGAREQRLACLITRSLPEPVLLAEQASITIGRDGSCRLRIASDDVSRQHAAVVLRGDHVEVTDRGSRNGTWVDGRRLEAPRQLPSGAVFLVANHHPVEVLLGTTSRAAADRAARLYSAETTVMKLDHGADAASRHDTGTWPALDRTSGGRRPSTPGD